MTEAVPPAQVLDNIAWMDDNLSESELNCGVFLKGDKA